MKLHHRTAPLVALCLAAATQAASAQSTAAGGAEAQAPQATTQATSGSSPGSGSNWLMPYRRGYVGLNLGKPTFDVPCGAAPFTCDDPNVGGYVYTGGLFNDWVGMELGYMYSGQADRAGGQTRAQAVNLSLVLRAPMGAFNAFAKGGAAYGQTRVSTDPLALDVVAGKQRGWGGVYGVGVGWDFSSASGLVLEWSRHELRFPGGGRENLDMTSLGYVHRY